MPRRAVWVSILLLMLAPILGRRAAAYGRATVWTGEVIGVTDGDTIKVLRESDGAKTPVKVRLYGVDCPERNQAFGQKAKLFTAKFVFGERVRVETVTRDRYGRIVARVFVGRRSLSEELVAAGLAWWYREYARTAHRLAMFEALAKQSRRGLWSDPACIPPWTYRRNGREGQASNIKAHKATPSAGAHRQRNGKLHCNVRSQVCHAASCHHYTCKHCKAAFKNMTAAGNAGYRPHQACMTDDPTHREDALRGSSHQP